MVKSKKGYSITRYFNNPAGLLKLKKEREGGIISGSGRTEKYTYNDNKEVYYEDIKWERFLFCVIREVNKKFSFYNCNNKLIKSYSYDNKHKDDILFNEFKYDSSGKISEKWDCSITIEKPANLDYFEYLDSLEGITDYSKIRIDKNKEVKIINGDCKKFVYNELGDIAEVTVFYITFKEGISLPSSLTDLF